MDAPPPEQALCELVARTGLAEAFCVPSGAALFRQGDAADSLLAIQDGEVEIVARTPGDDAVVLARLARGAAIGELALIDGGLRSATARVARTASGLRLSREAFTMLRAARDPAGLALLSRLASLICERIRARIADLAATLPSAPAPRFLTTAMVDRTRWTPLPHPRLDAATATMLPLFRALGSSDRQAALLAAGSVYRVERGELLARAGTPADTAMIVLRGGVALSIDDAAGRRERCGVAPPGRLSSAVALIDGGPQALDAAAREHCELLCIERAALDGLRGGADATMWALEDALVGELARELRVVSAQLTRLAAHGRISAVHS